MVELILRPRVEKVVDLEELEQQISFAVLMVQMFLALVAESLEGHESPPRRFYHKSAIEECEVKRHTFQTLLV